MIRPAMLTTSDNPHDPFTDYDSWENFDIQNGYNTSSYLARIVKSSDDLSEEDQNMAINDAIDEIIAFNVTGNYKKVFYQEEDQS